MCSDAEYLEVIKRARLDNRECMSRLAGDVRQKIFVYIYRVTLDYHLAQDLSQETALEMLKSLNRLEIDSTGSFWAWVYRTALGKVQHHFRYQGNRGIERKTIFDGGELLKHVPKDHQSGLNNLLKRELSQAVLKAMGQIKVTYRNVLMLRCFEEMSYAEIVRITGGTEMQARLLFFRAKKSLKKQLARNGFEKDLLLPALGLFGAITTSSTRSASAAITVSSSAAKVGVGTVIVGAATSKTGIVAAAVLAAAMLTTVGTVKVMKEDKIVNPAYDGSLRGAVQSGNLKKPIAIIGEYNPGNNGWKGADYLSQRRTTESVLPEELLIGERKRTDLVIIIPKGSWLELGFSGEIVDGPGADVCFDGRMRGELPQIFLTDGAGEEFPLTSTASFQSTGGDYGFVGFDISELSVPFKVRALRFVGADSEGIWGGSELYAVWARVSQE